MISEDKKFLLGQLEELNDNHIIVNEIARSESIHDEWALQMKFGYFGKKGLKILTSSPDKTVIISNLNLGGGEYFFSSKNTKNNLKNSKNKNTNFTEN